MSLILPNTFANRQTDILLSDLDDNFVYLATELDATNASLTLLTGTLGVSGNDVSITGKITANQIVNSSPFYYNTRTITANKTIASGEGVLSVGSITIADGVTVTIEDGAEWTIV